MDPGKSSNDFVPAEPNKESNNKKERREHADHEDTIKKRITFPLYSRFSVKIRNPSHLCGLVVSTSDCFALFSPEVFDVNVKKHESPPLR